MGRIRSMEGLSVVCWHFHLILSSCLKNRCAFQSLFLYHSHCFLVSWSRRVVQIPAQVGGETHREIEILLRTWRKSAKTRLLQVPVWALWVCAFRVPRLVRTDGGTFLVSLPSGIRNTQEGTFSHRLPKYSPNSHSALLEMNSNLLQKIDLVLPWKQTPHCPMTLPGKIKGMFKN